MELSDDESALELGLSATDTTDTDEVLVGVIRDYSY